jgi:ABC transport system ATP-binding/permease protein
VNEQQVKCQILAPGDELRMGPFRLIYKAGQLEPGGEQHGIQVDACHLTTVVHQETPLLNDPSPRSGHCHIY